MTVSHMAYRVEFHLTLTIVSDDYLHRRSKHVKIRLNRRGELAMGRREEVVCRVNDVEFREKDCAPGMLVWPGTDVNIL